MIYSTYETPSVVKFIVETETSMEVTREWGGVLLFNEAWGSEAWGRREEGLRTIWEAALETIIEAQRPSTVRSLTVRQ